MNPKVDGSSPPQVETFSASDQGSVIIIWDNDDYIAEARNQIFNDKCYKPVYLNTVDEINSILDKLWLYGCLDNQKSEIRKRLSNNITIECIELASYCDIHI